MDINRFTKEIMGKIIMEVTFGPGYLEDTIDFEEADGTYSTHLIVDYIDLVFLHCVRRPSIPINLVFPFLAKYAITSNDRRIKRNVDTLKAYLSKIVDAQLKVRKEKSQDGKHNHVLSILLDSELYLNNRDLLI